MRLTSPGTAERPPSRFGSLPTPWIAYYESLPGGRTRISEENLFALQAAHPDRLLFSQFRRRLTHVLLLDFPFKVGEKCEDMNAYYLRRITIRELPGWNPSLSDLDRRSPMRQDKLLAARLVGDASQQGAVELTLEHLSETFKARHAGCPVPLLKCEVATLNQQGVLGRKLVDLQDLRLISAD